jgi:cytochrome d ubiquinol oxidase subunit II
MGLVSLTTLTAHGSNYIAMKTEGIVQSKARTAAGVAWWGMLTTSVLALPAASSIRPEIWTNYWNHPWGFLFPTTGLIGLFGMFLSNRANFDKRAFLFSSLFIAGMLASTAFGLYPNVLPASTDPSYSLTIYNTAAQEYGLTVGLAWWLVGMIFAAGYFVYVYRCFKGKVVLEETAY